MSSSLILRASLALALSIGVAACHGDADADAYGNFEADEVVVSAETQGRILRLDAIEGQVLDVGASVGLVDTTQLALEQTQLIAQRGAIVLQQREVSQQRSALDVQLEIAQRAKERTDRLFASGAATSTQRDQVERDVRVLTAQAAASRASEGRVAAEAAALDARLAAVRDRLSRASLTNPIRGTVLAQYARAGEMIAPGQPLYRIANLDTLTLRAYVDGTQLASVALGAAVEVHVDGAEGLTALRGIVGWVSPRSEFTPTPVQTRNERAELVYAVKIRVANSDGALKVGMPGDVTFGTIAAAEIP
jgi:HlyD family secretion protein